MIFRILCAFLSDASRCKDSKFFATAAEKAQTKRYLAHYDTPWHAATHWRAINYANNTENQHRSPTLSARCTLYVRYMYGICTLSKRTNT
ncbi:MAG: hypothetical protein IJK99_00675, partial [Bacteroidales bacterium]|nr:hypothetical protein [Bacteroidales bacterium]